MASALFASVVMYVPGQLGLLDWLERISMQVVTHFSHSDEASPLPPLPGQAPNPRLLLIDDPEFEVRFAQRTPMDRGELATLVRGIAAQKPAALVVDYDLSPLIDSGLDAKQAALNAALLDLAKTSRVVLLAPFGLYDQPAMQRNHAWMRELCAASPNLDFAFGTLVKAQGAVMRYDPLAPTLGPVAARLLQGPGQRTGLCAEVLSGPQQPPAFLDRFMERDSSDRQGRIDPARMTPINPAVFRHALAVQQPLSFGMPDDLAGTTVFLGGSHGQEDRFLTVSGMQPGAMVHVAAYHSSWQPIRPISHHWLFLLQFGGAFVLLLAFQGVFWLVGRLTPQPRGLSEESEHQERADVLPGRRDRISTLVTATMPFLLPFILNGALLIVAAALIIGALVLSVGLMANATWFNPAALILTTFALAKKGHQAKMEDTLRTEVRRQNLVLHYALEDYYAGGRPAQDRDTYQLALEARAKEDHERARLLAARNSLWVRVLGCAPETVCAWRAQLGWLMPLLIFFATGLLAALAALFNPF